jgi:hypothetical protein
VIKSLSTQTNRPAASHAGSTPVGGFDYSLGLSFAMDLTPLVTGPEKENISFVQAHIQRFSQDVSQRLQRTG